MSRKTPLEWAQDPNATPEQLEQVLDKHPKEVLENPVLDLYILQDPEIGMQIWQGAWWVWLRREYNGLREGVTRKQLIEFVAWLDVYFKRIRPDLYRLGEIPPFKIWMDGSPAEEMKTVMSKTQDIIRRENNEELLRFLSLATAELARIRGKTLEWPRAQMKPNRRRIRR